MPLHHAPGAGYAAYLVAARLARLDQQPIHARQLLDEGASIGAARGRRRVQVTLLLEKVWLCLLEGRLAEADASAHRIESLAQAASKSRLDSVDFQRAVGLARAWCELAEGRAVRAVAALQPLVASAGQEGRAIDRFGALGSLALARLAAGDAPAACSDLFEALRLVQATGALRALADQPVALQPLLKAALRDAAAMVVNR